MIPAVTKTLTAMWLVLLDRLGEPVPEKPKAFAVVEREQFARHLKRLGGQGVMDAWRDACGRLERAQDASAAFNKMLGKDKWNGR